MRSKETWQQLEKTVGSREGAFTIRAVVSLLNTHWVLSNKKEKLLMQGRERDFARIMSLNRQEGIGINAKVELDLDRNGQCIQNNERSQIIWVQIRKLKIV